MLKVMVSVLSLTFVIATGAVAQPLVDPVVFEQGQQLYQDHCAVCHQDSGTGHPPTLPALSGNDQLGNPGRIVRTIRRGTGCSRTGVCPSTGSLQPFGLFHGSVFFVS